MSFVTWSIFRVAGDYDDDRSLEKPMACPPMSPDKQLIVRENNDYAFDNPYFKDDETDHGAAEKGEIYTTLVYLKRDFMKSRGLRVMVPYTN